MVTARQLRRLRGRIVAGEETERLRARLAAARAERVPMYLTLPELQEVIHWKLEGQYGRAARYYAGLTDDVVRAVTGAALAVRHEDWRYETEVKLGVLMALPGVGAPIASSVLALTDPEHYGVIDFRGWRALFDEDRRSFTIAEYVRYLDALRTLARELKWPVQDVDIALWQYDRDRTAG